MLDNDLPTMDRHWWRIELAFRTYGLSPFLDPRALHVSTSYPVAVRNGRTTIPPTAARAQEDETILDDGI